VKVIDATGTNNEGKFDLKAPVFSANEAKACSLAADNIQEKYRITDEDMNTLFNCMLTVFMRVQFCRTQGYDGEKKGNS